MSLLQLNPPLPLITPQGKGYAHLVWDLGPEHHLYFWVTMDADGTCWVIKNPDVRFQDNITMDRPLVEQPKHNRSDHNRPDHYCEIAAQAIEEMR